MIASASSSAITRTPITMHHLINIIEQGFEEYNKVLFDKLDILAHYQ